MEVTINYNGQAVAVEVTLEVYEFLDRADHKTENLFHEQRRHWDGREFDEYIITTEGVGGYESLSLILFGRNSRYISGIFSESCHSHNRPTHFCCIDEFSVYQKYIRLEYIGWHPVMA